VKTATTLNADRVPASAAWAELPKLPARALFVVLLVIMLAIGPVNIAVLAKKRRPMLLYATVPAVALVSSLSLVGYALSNEGLARSVTRSLLTLLDESEQRAVTIGWTGYYTTFTPGGGLLFSQLTELGSSGEPWQWGRQPKRLALDFTEGQRLARGFVEARVPARFSVRHVETRRERLRSPKATRVTNGLGIDLATCVNAPLGLYGTTVAGRTEGDVTRGRQLERRGTEFRPEGEFRDVLGFPEGRCPAVRSSARARGSPASRGLRSSRTAST
jgi:hypothetical protein